MQAIIGRLTMNYELQITRMTAEIQRLMQEKESESLEAVPE